MNFSKENNKSIIDEMYENKREDYESFVDSKRKGDRDCSIINELLDKIERCGKSSDILEKTRKKIKEYCDELDSAVGRELNFWQKNFYKFGFIDGMRMSEDLKTETKLKEE